MSSHGSDFKLSDSFFAGIRTVAAIDKAKGKRMTHTPGPWTAERKDKHSTMHVIAGHFRVFLGTHEGAPAAEWDANARLIAAAPELLEALTEIAEHAIANDHGSFNVSADRIRLARQLIARTTGQ